MLNVVDDGLVIEAKGIYSIEKFIIARRLMYWQVYLHKTVLSAESLLIKILIRAKELAKSGVELFATPALRVFLYNNYTKSDFEKNPDLLYTFAKLDDFDIFTSVKVWSEHEDLILGTLCKNLTSRNLFKIEIQNKPFKTSYIEKIKQNTAKTYQLKDTELEYFVFTDTIGNNAYNPTSDKINILYKDCQVIDIAQASDELNISVLSKNVIKYYLCYPKDCRE